MLLPKRVLSQSLEDSVSYRLNHRRIQNTKRRIDIPNKGKNERKIFTSQRLKTGF